MKLITLSAVLKGINRKSIAFASRAGRSTSHSAVKYNFIACY